MLFPEVKIFNPDSFEDFRGVSYIHYIKPVIGII